jgi:hypothetical protein
LPWLVGSFVVSLICLDKAESTAVRDPGSWLIAVVVASTVLTLLGAAWTLGRRRWREVAIYAALAASAIAIPLFAVSSIPTSRDCDNSGQPRSAGTFDCDTSFGLGGPLVLAALFVPMLGVAALGKGAAGVIRRTESFRESRPVVAG